MLIGGAWQDRSPRAILARRRMRFDTDRLPCPFLKDYRIDPLKCPGDHVTQWHLVTRLLVYPWHGGAPTQAVA